MLFRSQTGIPKSTICRKLSFGNFSLEEADRLSMALGVKLSTLIRRAEALASKEGGR